MLYEGVDKPDTYLLGPGYIDVPLQRDGIYFPARHGSSEVYSVRFRMRLDMHAGLHSAYIGREVLGTKHRGMCTLFPG
jgi:hypothetical protein